VISAVVAAIITGVIVHGRTIVICRWTIVEVMTGRTMVVVLYNAGRRTANLCISVIRICINRSWAVNYNDSGRGAGEDSSR
jgi:hypothetical protein